jgi:hypothetical protein
MPAGVLPVPTVARIAREPCLATHVGQGVALRSGRLFHLEVLPTELPQNRLHKILLISLISMKLYDMY